MYVRRTSQNFGRLSGYQQRRGDSTPVHLHKRLSACRVLQARIQIARESARVIASLTLERSEFLFFLGRGCADCAHPRSTANSIVDQRRNVQFTDKKHRSDDPVRDTPFGGAYRVSRGLETGIARVCDIEIQSRN